MSTTDSTASSGSDGLSYFWVAVRLAGGTLGVLTLLSIATVGLGVEYKAFFQEFLNRLKDLIELAPLLDPVEKYVVHPILDGIRDFGWTVPELAEHWRYVFSLTWLLLLAIARNVIPLGNGGAAAVGYFWAGLCALASAVVAGLVPLNDYGVILSPLTGMLVFLVPMGSIFAKRRIEGLFPYGYIAIVMVIAMALFMGPIVVNSSTPAGPSLSLLIVAAMVALMGIGFIVIGLTSRGLAWQKRLTNPGTATGLDIVGVMGAALFIGWLMQA